MGADEYVPLILGSLFLYTTNVIIYVGSGQIHFQFPRWKVKCAFNGYKANKQVKTARPKRRSCPTKLQGNQKKGEQAKKAEQVKEDKPTEPKPQSIPEQVWRVKEPLLSLHLRPKE